MMGTMCGNVTAKDAGLLRPSSSTFETEVEMRQGNSKHDKHVTFTHEMPRVATVCVRVQQSYACLPDSILDVLTASSFVSGLCLCYRMIFASC